MCVLCDIFYLYNFFVRLIRYLNCSCLFEGVMKGLEPWYVVSETGSQPDPRSTLLNAQPFARPQVCKGSNMYIFRFELKCENLIL